jgi:hypothetical protein
MYVLLMTALAVAVEEDVVKFRERCQHCADGMVDYWRTSTNSG